MNIQDDIAFRIRAEMVCCNQYGDVWDGYSREEGHARYELLVRSTEYHDLCYWGEGAARLAEGRCPGYETKPNICRCACEGCKYNCSAHHDNDFNYDFKDGN